MKEKSGREVAENRGKGCGIGWPAHGELEDRAETGKPG